MEELKPTKTMLEAIVKVVGTPTEKNYHEIELATVASRRLAKDGNVFQSSEREFYVIIAEEKKQDYRNHPGTAKELQKRLDDADNGNYKVTPIYEFIKSSRRVA